MSAYQAVVCAALTGPDALRVESRPRSHLRPGEVRLRVLAAGVNFPDLLMTRGEYQFRPEPPFIPGLEVAGEVIEVGDSVSLPLGAQVCGSAALGGYATESVLPVTSLKPWPAGFSAAQAAGFYVTAWTAWHGLVDRGAAEAGERLLVLGAGGGVGLAAVQLGRALGLEVWAAARDPARLEAAGRAGASQLFSMHAPLREALETAAGPRPIDLVFDPVGGPAAIEAAGGLAWGGRYLIVGFASGQIPSLAFNRLLLAGYSVLGVRAGEHARRHTEAARLGLERLNRLAVSQDLRPVIGLEAPLSDAAEVLAALGEGRVTGKAVLIPG